MTSRSRSCLDVAAFALAIALAAARCDKNVVIGVDPKSDAAISDAGDAGVGE